MGMKTGKGKIYYNMNEKAVGPTSGILMLLSKMQILVCDEKKRTDYE